MSIISRYPSSRPTTYLNFKKKRVSSSGINFSRASTATYFDENGIIQTATTNEPRFNYDSETGEFLGLLVEDQRTNYTTDSTIVNGNSSFGNGGLQSLPAGVTTPDGSTQATLINPGTLRLWFQGLVNSNLAGAPTGLTTILSFYAYSINESLVITPNVFSSPYKSIVNTTTPGKWVRIYTTSVTSGSNLQYRLANYNSSAYSQDQFNAGERLYVWGMQVEIGESYPSSYIPTSGSAVTREADIFELPIKTFKSGRIQYSTSPDVITTSYYGNISLRDSVNTPEYSLEIGTANSIPLVSTRFSDNLQSSNSLSKLPSSTTKDISVSFNFDEDTGRIDFSTPLSDDADASILRLSPNNSRKIPEGYSIDKLKVLPGTNIKEIYLWEEDLDVNKLSSLSEDFPSINTQVVETGGYSSNKTDYDDLPSLDLDFAGNKSLDDNISGDNLITFTRTSPATYVDSEGIIRTAGANLFAYSEEFNNTWFGNEVTINPNVAIAPNGSNTADELVPSTNNNAHYIYQNILNSISKNTFYTQSIYAKANGYDTLEVYTNSIYNSFVFGYTKFDLTNGKIISNTGGTSKTASIKDVGNGWYRCSVTDITTSSVTSGSGSMRTYWYVNQSTSYAGDGTSSIYLWGAQLEEGSSVSDYVKTTNTLNYIPRYDHDPETGECLGLLIEDSRTNNILSSAFQTFDFPYGYFGISPQVSLVNNRGVAPDGTFTASLYEQIAACSNNQSRVSVNPTLNGNFDSNSQYYFSYFAKLQEPSTTNKVGFSFSTQNFSHTSATTATYLSARFLFSNDGEITSVETAYSDPNSLYEKYANGWYRISIPIYSGSVQTNAAGVNISIGDELGLSPGTYGKFLIWGACIEKGNFTTSYIPSLPTFTSRSTTATYYDANGIIQTAAINEARDNAYLPDENGVMRPAGLLLEAARTNIKTNSQVFTSGWNRTGIDPITQNTSITTPEGLTDGVGVITESSGGTVHQVYSATTVQYTGYYTYSIFVKPNGRNYVVFSDSSFTHNLSDGTTIGSPSGEYISAKTEKFPNGWYRCSLVRLHNNTFDQFNLKLADGPGSISYSGDGVSGVYIWGAQQEVSTYTTSYIPTNGTPGGVTRAVDESSSSTTIRTPDIASITGTNFSSWYNQGDGTFYGKGSQTYSTPNKFESLIVVGNFPNRSWSWAIVGSVNRWDSGTDGLGAGPFYTGLTPNIPFSYSVAQAQKNNDCAIATDGVITGTSAPTQTIYTNSTILYIGFNYTGTVKRLTYWPTRLPDTTLQAITSSAVDTFDLVFDSSVDTTQTIINTDITSIITTGNCTYEVDWGDGSAVETIVASGTFSADHRYILPSKYTAKINVISGAFRLYYNNNTKAEQLVEIRQTPDGWTNTSTSGFGTSLDRAYWRASNLKKIDKDLNTSGINSFSRTWQVCSSLTEFPLIDTSSVTNFSNSWEGCINLTSFPLIDTSSGTIFQVAWRSCASLTEFPLINTSNGTNFDSTWRDCSSLTSFPLIDTSSGTNFYGCWRSCSGLTRFPSLDFSNGTNFYNAWKDCSNLTSFPGNMFDTIGSLSSLAFTDAFANCSLSSNSISNILVSLDTNGQSNNALSISGVNNAGMYSWFSPAWDGFNNLVSKGWTISKNDDLFDAANTPLDLQFATTKTLDSRITFTRSSTGTYVDANGIIQTATVDTPRFDHDPDTLESLGLKMERESINIARTSNLSDAWIANSNTSPAPTNNTQVAPDGTTTAWVLPSGTGFVQRNYTVTTGQNYTVSFFAKQGIATEIFTGTMGFPLPGPYVQGSIYNWNTDTLYPGWKKEDYQNGWSRFSYTFVNAPGTILVVRLDTSVTSDRSGYYIWGLQIENNTAATSYIPNSSSTSDATRSSEVASISDVSYINQSEGTFFTTASRIDNGFGSSRVISNTNATAGYIILTPASASTFDGSNAVVSTSLPPAFVNVASTYTPSEKSIASGGNVSAPVARNSAFPLTPITSLIIAPPAGNNYFWGIISRITYWPKRLPDGALKYITQ